MNSEQLNEWLKKKKERRKNLTSDKLFDGILKQSNSSLSASITLL